MPTKDEIVEENAALRARVEELEAQLSEAQATRAGEALATAGDGGDAMAQLAAEKERSAKLTARVEELEQALRELAPVDDVDWSDEATAEPGETDDGLCAAHFPDGWKGVPEEHAGVGCEHGSYTRPAAE